MSSCETSTENAAGRLEMQPHRSHRQEVNDLKNKSENLKVELDGLSEAEARSPGGTSLESEELQLMSEHPVFKSASSEMLALQIELTAVEGVNELQNKQEQLEWFSSSLLHQADQFRDAKGAREGSGILL